MTWLTNEAIESIFVRPCKNVASTFCAAQVRAVQLQVMDAAFWTLLAHDQSVDHLHAGHLGLCLARCLLTGLVVCFLQLSYETLAMVPELAVLTLDATSKGSPVMSCWGGFGEQIAQELLFLLDAGNSVLDVLLFPMQEVGFLFEKNAHSFTCTEKDLVCIFIHMSLKVEDVLGLEQLACLVGQLLCVSLGDPPHLILSQLFRGEKKRPDMPKVFILQTCEQIREGFKSHMRFPGFANSSIIERNRCSFDNM